MRKNADKLKAARARGTEPYFVRNNFTVVENIMNPKKQLTPLEIARQRHAARTPEQIADVTERWKLRQQEVKFAEKLRTNDWDIHDMNEWESMNVSQRLGALRRSKVDGLVPDDFFDETSGYVDIYKAKSKESILMEVDDMLMNAANGYNMQDIDRYLAF